MTPARYDRVADFYAAGWADDADDPATASLLDLLGPVGGMTVLDLACGHGRISRALARRGASVVAVDISAALLAHATRQQEAEPLDIRYVEADASTVEWLDGRTFPAVVCAFGLSDVDDLDGCIGTVAQALRPGGRFVFCILHPCFPGGDDASASWPTDGAYWDEGWWLADREGSGLRRRVGGHHRMLSTYVNRLAAHGLTVERLDEPEPTAAWRERQPDAAGFPLFLVARCRNSA